MSLPAGSLNRWIEVHKRAAGKDALNRPNGALELFVGLWCNIRGATGMSTIRDNAGVTSSVNQYSFRVRYREDLTEDMVVIRNGQHFRIVDIKHDMADQEWTDIVCEVGGNNG